MSLSLDSSTVIDLLRGRDLEVKGRFDLAKSARTRLFLSTLVISELSYGIANGEAHRREEKLRQLDTLIEVVDVVSFDVEDAMAAGKLRTQLPTGRPIGAVDVLIGAQALARGWSVVTSDVRHFGRIPGLSIVDWRLSDLPLTYREIMDRLKSGFEDK